MIEKLSKLKKHILWNIIGFFIEFFLLSSVFQSSLDEGALFKWLTTNFSFTNKGMLLIVSSLLMVLSVKIRFMYAKYLNSEIDIIEKQINDNKKENNKNKQGLMEMNNLISKNKDYQKNQVKMNTYKVIGDGYNAEMNNKKKMNNKNSCINNTKNRADNIKVANNFKIVDDNNYKVNDMDITGKEKNNNLFYPIGNESDYFDELRSLESPDYKKCLVKMYKK